MVKRPLSMRETCCSLFFRLHLKETVEALPESWTQAIPPALAYNSNILLSQYSLFEYKIDSVLGKSTQLQNLESQLSKRKRNPGK